VVTLPGSGGGALLEGGVDGDCHVWPSMTAYGKLRRGSSEDNEPLKISRRSYEIMQMTMDQSASLTRVVDPNRHWRGSAFQETSSVLVLGESYVGTYEDDSEYDDVYWQQCLDGQRTDPLFDALQTKLGIAASNWWPGIAYTNLCIGSIGRNTQTVVTSAQLRAGLPRLGRLLDRLQPRGVLVLGAATRDVAGPYIDKRGMPRRWVYHPSGKNNWMNGGRYACTPDKLQAAWRDLVAA
jgi:hypothetical protein